MSKNNHPENPAGVSFIPVRTCQGCQHAWCEDMGSTLCPDYVWACRLHNAALGDGLRLCPSWASKAASGQTAGAGGHVSGADMPAEDTAPASNANEPPHGMPGDRAVAKPSQEAPRRCSNCRYCDDLDFNGACAPNTCLSCKLVDRHVDQYHCCLDWAPRPAGATTPTATQQARELLGQWLSASEAGPVEATRAWLAKFPKE